MEKQIKRAQAFADALGDSFVAQPEDRIVGLQAEIDDLKLQLANETNPLHRMVLSGHIGQLLELKGIGGLAEGFAGVVIFSEPEIHAIKGLLVQAAHDIQSRQDMAAAIRVTTSMITAAAQIAGKVATAGLL